MVLAIAMLNKFRSDACVIIVYGNCNSNVVRVSTAYGYWVKYILHGGLIALNCEFFNFNWVEILAYINTSENKRIHIFLKVADLSRAWGSGI